MAMADSNLDETCPPPSEQGVPRIDTSAVEAAEELREALAQHGIAADVHYGYVHQVRSDIVLKTIKENRGFRIGGSAGKPAKKARR